MTIYPTHTCFDDALDFIAEIANTHPTALVFEGYKLVHAICLMPNGTPYAHAWVEDAAGNAYFFGFIKGERGRITVDAKEYRAELRVQEAKVYTPYEAFLENRKNNNYGPWVEKYRQLCKNPREAAA